MRSWLSLMSVLTLAASCGDPTGLGSADELATRTVVVPTVLGPTDTAVVTVVARNTTRRPIEFASSCRSTVFHVYRGAERVTQFGCPIPESEIIRVLPGDSLTATYQWSIIRYVGSGVRDTLPAGTYAVRGGVDVRGDFRGQSAPVTLIVQRP